MTAVVSREKRKQCAEWMRMSLCEVGLAYLAHTVAAASDRHATEIPGVAMTFRSGAHASHRAEIFKARMLRLLRVCGPDHPAICSAHCNGDARNWPDCRMVRVSDGLLGFTCEQRPAWNGGEP